MSVQDTTEKTASRWRPSLDTWAVLLAFLLALLVRTGALKHVPW